jgi:hypothetical protein
LLGGAVRRASSTVLPYIETIKPLLALAADSTELSVRKAACKLNKDVLRGIGSFYTTSCPPGFEPKNGVLLGTPVASDTIKVNWFVPTKECLQAACSLIGPRIEDSLSAVTKILENASSSSPEALTPKKMEEEVLKHLGIIRCLLRGSAELLGNGSLCNEDSIMSTGKDILSVLSSDNRELLCEFRPRILCFIIKCNENIDKSSELSALRDSVPVRSLLLRILDVIINRRMASIKEPDGAKRSYTHIKNFTRSSVVRYMKKSTRWLTNHGIDGSKGKGTTESSIGTFSTATLRDPKFWKCHDFCTRFLRSRVAIQRAFRMKQYSFASTRATLQIDSSRELYLSALEQVVSLCGHEYDAIRKHAQDTFRSISGRFGFNLNSVVAGMIKAVGTEGTSYSLASGAMNLLKNDRVMRRVTGHIELCSSFLASVQSSQSMITAVAEPDKRQALLSALANMYVSYTRLFHHIPLSLNTDPSILPTVTMSNALESFGYSADVFSSVHKGLESRPSSGGLRFDAFSAFTIIHLVGHSYTTPAPRGLWSWAISYTLHANGEPTQLLALSALTKLSFMAYRDEVASGIIDVRDDLKSAFGLTEQAPDNWKRLITRISHDANSKSEGGSSAQWAEGIDHLLRGSEFLSSVLPRHYCSPVPDGNFGSRFFKKELGALFMSLSSLASEGGHITPDVLEMILEASKNLSSSSEEENKGNNLTCSEMFSGLCRAVGAIVPTSTQENESNLKMESMLATYLLETVEKHSLEFSKDWAEAVGFGLGGFDLGRLGKSPIVYSILCRLRLSLQVGHSSSLSEDEGFAKEGKILHLTVAVLLAETYRSPAPSTTPAFTKALINILCEPASLIASPYRTSRQSMATILTKIVHANPDYVNILPIVTRLEKIAMELKSPLDDMDVVDESNSDTGGDGNEKIGNVDPAKHAIELASLLLTGYLKPFTPGKYYTIFPTLLKITFHGCSNGNVQFAKSCHVACVQAVNALRSTNMHELTIQCLDILREQAKHTSWHTRESAIMCAGFLISNNLAILTLDEKKSIRDIFNAGFLDPRPEVQMLAQLGMVAYLSCKPLKELTKLATSYEKNCNVLADKEKRRKKQAKVVDNGNGNGSGSGSGNSAAGDAVPDKTYVTTIMMTSCMIRSFPYDLPDYIPSLLISLIRHSSCENLSLKNTVVSTVQDFKRTHQDRWKDFKTSFSNDMLEDLQGAGAATYFSFLLVSLLVVIFGFII